MAVFNTVVSGGGGQAPAHYIEFTVDANGVAQFGSQIMDFSGITDVGNNVFYYKYYRNTNISGIVDMSDLTSLSYAGACEEMFSGCTGITSVNLSSLTTISGDSACKNMFSACTHISSVDLSSLTTISTNSFVCSTMFIGCTSLTSIDLSSLTTISALSGCSAMFRGCTNLTSVDLSGLTTITGSGCMEYMFYGCTSLTSLSFPALTSNSFGSNIDQFTRMLQGVTGCTVHFPSNLQSVIGSWASVTAGFGGTNTTVLFDLTATS